NAIGICPLGSLVVVVVVIVVVAVVVVIVSSCRPAPTILGQMANLLGVIAPWCPVTVMMVVALRT
ncbi:hypothetical protein Tco_0621293, partial [Tanacetum coccineum]